MVDVPDNITINVSEKETLFADRADLFLQIHAKSFFSGRAALKKVKEINVFADALVALGVKEKDIQLQGIETDINSSSMGSNSSAIYKLLIVCDNLENLSGILSIITDQKNIKLNRTLWIYSKEDQCKEKLLQKCLIKSKKKAEQVASAFNVNLLGIWSFSESIDDIVTYNDFYDRHYSLSLKKDDFELRKPANKQSFVFSVSHTKDLQLKLKIQYRISAMN